MLNSEAVVLETSPISVDVQYRKSFDISAQASSFTEFMDRRHSSTECKGDGYNFPTSDSGISSSVGKPSLTISEPYSDSRLNGERLGRLGNVYSEVGGSSYVDSDEEDDGNLSVRERVRRRRKQKSLSDCGCSANRMNTSEVSPRKMCVSLSDTTTVMTKNNSNMFGSRSSNASSTGSSSVSQKKNVNRQMPKRKTLNIDVPIRSVTSLSSPSRRRSSGRSSRPSSMTADGEGNVLGEAIEMPAQPLSPRPMTYHPKGMNSFSEVVRYVANSNFISSGESSEEYEDSDLE